MVSGSLGWSVQRNSNGNQENESIWFDVPSHNSMSTADVLARHDGRHRQAFQYRSSRKLSLVLLSPLVGSVPNLAFKNGTITTASSSTNTDLYFALKGGLNRFGIVTSAEFYTHPQLDNVWVRHCV